MLVHFDLNNNRCVFEFQGETHNLDTRDETTGPFWTYTFASCTDNEQNQYSVTWKSWNNHEQFVEVQVFDRDAKVPWRTLVSWSYVANPQAGTSQTRKIKHRGAEGSVSVTGSPIGDWSSSRTCW